MVAHVVDVAKYEDSLNRIVFAHKANSLDERSLASGVGLEPLTSGEVLGRLKRRATTEWSSETDDDIIEAMSDVINCM